MLFAAPVSDETVTNLRHRLMVMKEILNEEENEDDAKQRKKLERRKKKNCLDTIIDGSFMGLILVKIWTEYLDALSVKAGPANIGEKWEKKSFSFIEA